MDVFTKEKRSDVMSRIRSKDTTPEIALRKALWQRGFRYRLQYGKERIDIAFPRQRVAIFVDGCFWHLCPIHGLIPKTNQRYWIPKLEGNIRRGVEKDERLAKKGWLILHFWEHEMDNPEKIADKVEEALKRSSKLPTDYSASPASSLK